MSAAGDRARTWGMYAATGAMYGFGTEHQRTAAMVSKHRPTTPGQIAGGTGVDQVRKPADAHMNPRARRGYEDELVSMVMAAFDDGEPIELELQDGTVVHGLITDVMNTGLWLDDEWVEGMEVVSARTWSMYQGDERRDYEIPESRLR